jgi:hypothetical protein
VGQLLPRPALAQSSPAFYPPAQGDCVQNLLRQTYRQSILIVGLVLFCGLWFCFSGAVHAVVLEDNLHGLNGWSVSGSECECVFSCC